MSDFNEQHAFLGLGCHFPVTVDTLTGHMQESAYEQNIKESIYLIIMTKKGERVMRPDFGCDIHSFMFDTMDFNTLTRMEQGVREALIRWEPRIHDIEVEVRDDVKDNNAVQIDVKYRVRNTNSPYNLVFPFYLEET